MFVKLQHLQGLNLEKPETKALIQHYSFTENGISGVK